METIQLIILQASEGHKMYNAEARAIGMQVQLSPTDSADNWVEITEEEAEALQKQWEEEMKAKEELPEEPMIEEVSMDLNDGNN